VVTLLYSVSPVRDGLRHCILRKSRQRHLTAESIGLYSFFIVYFVEGRLFENENFNTTEHLMDTFNSYRHFVNIFALIQGDAHG